MINQTAATPQHSKLYFKNLDGLRFVAAFLVILSHCVLFRHDLDATLSNPFLYTISNFGAFGVQLFFVLSGFLITYLLLREREMKGRISIKQFYIRRVLRIWPLYFAAGLFGTLLAPLIFSAMGLSSDIQFVGVNLLFLLGFAVNFQNIFYYNRGIMEILWSVCVEEQFYLLWPWLMRWLRNRWIVVLLGCVVLAIASKLLILTLIAPSHIRNDLLYYLPIVRFDFFAVGGIAAYVWFQRERFSYLKLLNSGMLRAGIFTFNVALVLSFIKPPENIILWGGGLVYGGAFALLILALIAPGCPPLFESPFFRTPGRVSYGLYVLHPIVVQTALRLFHWRMPNSFVFWEIVFPLVATVITFGIAFLSYELCEKRFLALKNRFNPM